MMNLKEHIRKVLKEETKSTDMETVQTDLVNRMGKSDIKDGDRIKIVDKLISFGSSFRIIVDRLDQVALDEIVNFTKKNGWFPIGIGLSDMIYIGFPVILKIILGKRMLRLNSRLMNQKK